MHVHSEVTGCAVRKPLGQCVPCFPSPTFIRTCSWQAPSLEEVERRSTHSAEKLARELKSLVMMLAKNLSHAFSLFVLLRPDGSAISVIFLPVSFSGTSTSALKVLYADIGTLTVEGVLLDDLPGSTLVNWCTIRGEDGHYYWFGRCSRQGCPSY